MLPTAEPAILMMERGKRIKDCEARSDLVCQGLGKWSEASDDAQEFGRRVMMEAATLPGLVIKGVSRFPCRSKRATLPGVNQARAGITR